MPGYLKGLLTQGSEGFLTLTEGQQQGDIAASTPQ
jgi:hypothetical protein